MQDIHAILKVFLESQIELFFAFLMSIQTKSESDKCLLCQDNDQYKLDDKSEEYNQ